MNNKDYKKIAGAINYLQASRPAYLIVSNDEVRIENVLKFIPFITPKKVVIDKKDIKAIKYSDSWAYKGINFITDKYSDKELIFNNNMSKEQWKEALEEYGYTIE